MTTSKTTISKLFRRIVLYSACTFLFIASFDAQGQNVGIGTNAPTKDLDVDGELRVRNLPVGSTTSDALLTTDPQGNIRKIANTIPQSYWGLVSGSGLSGKIYHTGHAGVGATSATQLGTFTVRENNAATDGSGGVFVDIINSQTNTANTLSGIRLGNYAASSTNDYISAGILFNSTGQSFGRGDLIFANGATSNTVGVSNARMTIKSAGNIGIGENNPQSKLHVDGDIKIRREDKIHFGENSLGDAEFIQNSYSAANSPGYGLAFSTNSIERMRIAGDGNVGIGNTNPTSPLHVSKELARGTLQAYVGSGNWGYYADIDNPRNYNYGFRADITGDSSYGNYGIYTTVQDPNQFGAYGIRTYANNAANFCYAVWGSNSGTSGSQWAAYFAGRTYASSGSWTSSDRKLKKDIQPLQSGLDIINDLKTYTYQFKRDEYAQLNLSDRKQYGFLAQEVEQVIPEMVMDIYHAEEYDDKTDTHIEGSDVNFKGMNHQQLIPIMAKAIQELSDENEALKMQNAQVFSRLEALERKVDQ